MTTKLFTSVAAGALLLGASLAPVAYAQDSGDPAAGQTMEQPGATPEPGTLPDDTATTPDAAAPDTTTGAATDGTTPDATAPDSTADTATTDTDVSAAAGEKYITAQSENQVSANTYIGQTVYNGAEENIGKISDLIIEKDGGIAAAVVGVGGFLGIGEKWVAVPFDTISITQAPDADDVTLTTTETSESLKAAPEFKTRAQQVAERNAAAAPADPGMGAAPQPAP